MHKNELLRRENHKLRISILTLQGQLSSLTDELATQATKLDGSELKIAELEKNLAVVIAQERRRRALDRCERFVEFICFLLLPYQPQRY